MNLEWIWQYDEHDMVSFVTSRLTIFETWKKFYEALELRFSASGIGLLRFSVMFL